MNYYYKQNNQSSFGYVEIQMLKWGEALRDLFLSKAKLRFHQWLHLFQTHYSPEGKRRSQAALDSHHTSLAFQQKQKYKCLFFNISSLSPREGSYWPSLHHMPICQPIAVDKYKK